MRAKKAVTDSFAALAEELLSKNEREGKAAATLGKKRWLVSLAIDDLGDKTITEIAASDILVPLRRIEAQGNYETARRLRAVISQIFRYAIATARRGTTQPLPEGCHHRAESHAPGSID